MVVHIIVFYGSCHYTVPELHPAIPESHREVISLPQGGVGLLPVPQNQTVGLPGLNTQLYHLLNVRATVWQEVPREGNIATPIKLGIGP